MELKKLSEHIWYMPFEEERDRPNIGYVRGDKRSLAIDAGHSEAHIREFYDLLEKEGLPLPSITVLTHWHWDHTFAMHAVNGITIANKTTNGYLLEFMKKIEANGPDEFLNMNDCIRKEYEGGKEVIVVPADIVFEGDMTIGLGGCTVRLMRTKALCCRRKAIPSLNGIAPPYEGNGVGCCILVGYCGGSDHQFGLFCSNLFLLEPVRVLGYYCAHGFKERWHYEAQVACLGRGRMRCPVGDGWPS